MNYIEHMTGQQMAIAMVNDPQFKMPTYPRVSEGFQFINLNGNRLLVIGGPEKQLFRGKSIHDIVPYVVEKCDGTRSLQDILSSNDYPSENIFQVLSLLYSRGLLQEGESQAAKITHPLYKFFDTQIDGTRINKNVEEAINKVINTKVIIDYRSKEGKIASSILKEYMRVTGMNGDVSHNPKQKDNKEALIIGICTSDEEIPYWSEKSHQYYQEEIPFLLLWFRGEKLIVGPYVDNPETICFDCFTNQIERLNLSDVKEQTNRNQYHLGFSLVLPIITNIISEISILQLTQNYVDVFDLNTLDSQTILFTLSINCDSCRNQSINQSTMEKVNLVSQYESLIEFPSRKYLNLKSHQNHYKAKNLNLTKEFKDYFNSPRIDLKRFDVEDMDSPIRKIIRLMTYTTGIKEIVPHKVKRWCPTGGNLGSVNLYFLNRKVKQLDKSIYFFHPMRNELQQVTGEWNDVKQLFNQESNEVMGYFILTGQVQKLATKYTHLSFRLANLDAGVAMAQCQIVAEKLNWKTTRINGFNEDLISELLCLYDIGEIVTLVIEIREGI
ncbi:nitroreductase family protein [Virgibacillus sp.]|uniref:nitroreductase family protein n=1 Tax=Virgibacillus sp. TaxID=1872700 RepID=UPI0017E21594|nr:nitroreductase family protein [Virgibacillus sp.]NWO15021.1 nitroreductase family protein [Virgibacillus sp.]